MAEDINSLTKKVNDLEKRLKLAESKIKALSDGMTSPKDIERYLLVLEKKLEKDHKASGDKITKAMEKDLKRYEEVSEKLVKAEEKQRDKDNDQISKDMAKLQKTMVKEAEMNHLKHRLTNVEALVQAALAKR